ncbi:hypothetical protein ASPCAL05053 [Aspergillus calidoustus]|uniref:EthD domain-containing protein n=1 Tax=Aspergillus calidoustus TaxID=454130 RepID=A0A0U5C6D8_ASPCI|nr:hypothetical protein ASPCAL05053 [Aspergillus calidoustus]
MPYIKQLVVLRRKAGLTREEFFDYHYQTHGAISTAPTSAETPTKYFQTHLIDSAYHPDTSNKVPNAHPPWALSDGITELYFESPEHLEQVFRSEWVKTKVGPDGANFSDFSAVLPMFVREEEVALSGVSGSSSSSSSSLTPRQSEDPNTFVAVYFVAFRDGQAPASAEETVSQFAGSLQNHAGGEVAKLTVNVPAEAGFDLAAYFGGAGAAMPHYQFVFTVTLRGKESVSGVRRAQKEFEARFATLLDLASTWIAFGERAVVLDQTENIEFDRSRQPFKTL